jgi:hypothetical protein
LGCVWDNDWDHRNSRRRAAFVALRAPGTGAVPGRHPRAARYFAEHGRWANASSMASRFGSLRGAVEAAKVAGTLKRR